MVILSEHSNSTFHPHLCTIKHSQDLWYQKVTLRVKLPYSILNPKRICNSLTEVHIEHKQIREECRFMFNEAISHNRFLIPDRFF